MCVIFVNVWFDSDGFFCKENVFCFFENSYITKWWKPFADGDFFLFEIRSGHVWCLFFNCSGCMGHAIRGYWTCWAHRPSSNQWDCHVPHVRQMGAVLPRSSHQAEPVVQHCGKPSFPIFGKKGTLVFSLDNIFPLHCSSILIQFYFQFLGTRRRILIELIDFYSNIFFSFIEVEF